MSNNELVRRESKPWVTAIASVACVAAFVGLAFENNYESWDTLKRWGFWPAGEIWQGAYWGVLTSVFVHIELWHVVFNVYWLWVLGTRLERTIGITRYLAFVMTAAWVSSMFQLAMSDTTGIGMSGVVYAIFGLMWPCRQVFPAFKEVLTRQTIRIFVWWMFGCVALEYLKIWEVGNAAHLSGALFGGAVAGSFLLNGHRRLMRLGLASLLLLASFPLAWCPWSPTWLAEQAYRAHSEQRFDDAVRLYSQLIRRDPKNAWAYINRSEVNQVFGKREQADADYRKAVELDPAYARPGGNPD